MNKGDLVESVASELKTSKADAQRAVDAVLASISKGLKSDAKVNIVGFGTFAKRQRTAREGVNPITKQRMHIAASITCGFRPSAQLKEDI
ncbi:MAG: HU family DNA-binding protein [Phycisphaerales bacterium]